MSTTLDGEVAETRGGGTVQATIADLALAQRWLQRVPAVPEVVRSTELQGRAEVRVGWQGGWRDPVVQATLTALMFAMNVVVNAAVRRFGTIVWPYGCRSRRVLPAK